MYRFLFLIMILFSCSVSAESFQLAVFGDSLSAGHHLSEQDAIYSQLERKLLDRGYDVAVIHASRSGETTQGGLNRQGKLLAQKPDAVLLELGINDFLFLNYDLSETERNLETLVTRFLAQNIPVLLVGMKAPPAKPGSDRFEKMYQKIAQKYNLDFYPFYMDGIFDNVFSLGLPNKYLLSDNMHPNREGVALMVQRMMPTVERFLNHQGIFAR